MSDEKCPPVCIPPVKNQASRKQFDAMMGADLDATQNMLDLVRKAMPDLVAHDLLSVQGIELSDAMAQLFNNAQSEEKLRADGYEPLCEQTRLMWVKKSNEESN